LGKKHVLLYSTAGQVIWESGELDPKERVFHSERRGVLERRLLRAENATRRQRHLDASVAELICDRQQVLTTRLYRKPDGLLGTRVSDNDLPALISLEAWQLRPISSDRLTT
jgi:hypothetical protein